MFLHIAVVTGLVKAQAASMHFDGSQFRDSKSKRLDVHLPVGHAKTLMHERGCSKSLVGFKPWFKSWQLSTGSKSSQGAEFCIPCGDGLLAPRVAQISSRSSSAAPLT